jgi:hypothetical protein
MTYEIKHCHYHRLDPATHPRPALFEVYENGALVAVVREPIQAELKAAFESLFGKAYADSTENYRVDCCQAGQPLRAVIAGYFPGRQFEWHEDPGWVWRDNGTYEEMPWQVAIPDPGGN